jgi:hypothetical protein
MLGPSFGGPGASKATHPLDEPPGLIVEAAPKSELEPNAPPNADVAPSTANDVAKPPATPPPDMEGARGEERPEEATEEGATEEGRRDGGSVPAAERGEPGAASSALARVRPRLALMARSIGERASAPSEIWRARVRRREAADGSEGEAGGEMTKSTQTHPRSASSAVSTMSKRVAGTPRAFESSFARRIVYARIADERCSAATSVVKWSCSVGKGPDSAAAAAGDGRDGIGTLPGLVGLLGGPEGG